jgi:CBS domain containing-hemolysin-like protein
MLLDELLRLLRRQKVHISLVQDEHGTAVGIVTLEDVLEELVGEIEDEFDPQVTRLIQPDGDGWVVDGSAPLRAVEEEVGLRVEDPHEATIGGHVLEVLGRLPAAGEVVELDGGYRTEVLEVGEASIEKLRIARTPAGGDGD